ncbi:hypothetical protein J3R82DRAFT_2684 [Butyriboletus roseoflavus]|nr:hypothetical protein J3R82DRAFT_2684 [Butyriboletus roseoflavus]
MDHVHGRKNGCFNTPRVKKTDHSHERRTKWLGTKKERTTLTKGYHNKQRLRSNENEVNAATPGKRKCTLAQIPKNVNKTKTALAPKEVKGKGKVRRSTGKVCSTIVHPALQLYGRRCHLHIPKASLETMTVPGVSTGTCFTCSQHFCIPMRRSLDDECEDHKAFRSGDFINQCRSTATWEGINSHHASESYAPSRNMLQNAEIEWLCGFFLAIEPMWS